MKNSRTVLPARDLEIEAELEDDAPGLVDEPLRWIGKGLSPPKGPDGLGIQKVQPRVTGRDELSKAPSIVEGHTQDGVAILDAVDPTGRIALLIHAMGMPMTPNRLFDPVEEVRISVSVGSQERVLGLFSNVWQMIVRAEATR